MRPGGQPGGAAAAAPGTWAPLARPVFRWLAVAQLAGNLATWMQIVAAQWVLTESGSGAAMVALVQTAASLPVFLLALPAGVLADLLDRRRLLLVTNLAMAAVAAVLAVLAAAGGLTPWGLLGLTCALGCGTALAITTWQAVQPELVPRAEIPSAAALAGVNINVARSVGPALGGVVVAAAGPTWVFVLNAATFLAAAVIVAGWRPHQDAVRRAAERLGAAMRAGIGYVRYAPVLRRVLLRTALWAVPASALWALLPVVAAERLGLGPDGYGLLLGALGVGAVLGALALGPLRRRLTDNRLLLGAGLIYAAVTLVLALSRQSLVVAVALPAAGAAWTSVLAVLTANVLLMLPRWVRARGMASYTVVFQGGMALGSAAWGALADLWTTPAALVVAAVALTAAGLSALRLGLRDIRHIDPSLSAHWPEPQLALEPDPAAGPVLITAEYRVPAGHASAFVAAMQRVERSRRRTGGRRWALYQDGADPERFFEIYLVASWEEHLLQHAARLTVDDRAAEEAALSLTSQLPLVYHLFVPAEEDQSAAER
jgi:predicted MFS family arabinose efflux permease/quinol monooxygenase YgiN